MNRSIVLLKSFLNHELITGSFYIFVGGLASSFLAFLFNLFMARNLSYADYGILASLTSLFTLAIIPSQSLTSTIVRFATRFFAKGEEIKAAIFYKKMIVFWFGIGLLFFGAVSVFSPLISEFLKIEQRILIAIMGVTIALVYMSIVNIAFLQSLLKFRFLSGLYISGSLVKMILGVLLVYLGYSVGGALWAIVSMSLVGYLLGFVPLRSLLKNVESSNVRIDWKEIVYYALPTMAILTSVTSLVTSDVILVKHFFSAHDAGLYGGISLIGKVIFYFTAPITSVMFPLIVRKHAKGENFHGLFNLSLMLVAFSSLFITVFYYIFPQFSVKFFLGGGEYLRIAPFLGLFGFLITLYSVLYVMVNFFLSVKRTEIVYPCVLASILQVFLIYIFHNNFLNVIYATIFSSALLLSILVLYYIKQYGLHYAPK